MAAILKSFDVPLPPDLLADLRRVIDNKIHESTEQCAADIGVGKSSLIRAAAGLPCRPATIKVIAMGLAKIRGEGAAA